MGERAEPLQDWRERVLSDPDLILDDIDAKGVGRVIGTHQ